MDLVSLKVDYTTDPVTVTFSVQDESGYISTHRCAGDVRTAVTIRSSGYLHAAIEVGPVPPKRDNVPNTKFTG